MSRGGGPNTLTNVAWRDEKTGMAAPLWTSLQTLLLLGVCVAGTAAGQDASPPLQDMPAPPPPVPAKDLPEPPPPVTGQGLPEPPPEIGVTHVSLGSHVDSHLR